MASYFDPSYVAAAREVQAPDYLGMFYRSFNLANTLPWSAREQRKQAIENHALAMQQAKFSAEMEDRARNNHLQDLLLPYKIQQAQRLAAGPQISAPLADKYAKWTSLLQDGQAPLPQQEAPVPTSSIPDVPVDDLLPMQDSPQPDLNVIPDAPAY